ncbi:WhiB family transcriptional regulator [Streptomyces olivaceiscleroticus]|uniref:4Fe-4S Wbl-type domain-containing protein n=1 Tax=Streptomyces olivaceiscleroticus TaxID=68245 RepID=A0ABP3LH15_9ACTN
MPEHSRTTTDARTLLDALTSHRHYRYRGCAPTPREVADFPGQALGDPDLSVDAWSATTEDGGEAQKERAAREAAAKAVCASCPVLDACRAYALAETLDGKLAEPEGIWGGMAALERHRLFIRARMADGARTPEPTAAALAQARTDQKQAVLASLARETDEELVAYRAGMDVRTANWQRSLLCGLLGLDKETATRMQLLTAARALGVLPKGVRIRRDGAWPVPAAPDTTGARQRRIAAGAPIQLTLRFLDTLLADLEPTA